MNVSHFMTAYVPICRDNSTIAEAQKRLLNLDPGPFPVVDCEGRVVGILRRSDIRRASHRFGRIPARFLVGDAMLKEVCPCLPSDDVDVALDRMRASRLSRLPVVDASGKLVGAVSIVDSRLVDDDGDLESGADLLGEIHEPTVVDHRAPSYFEKS